MPHNVTERIIDYKIYNVSVNKHLYDKDPLLGFHNGFLTERVVLVGSYETVPYDPLHRDFPHFLHPFTITEECLQHMVESLLIAYKNLFGSTYVKFFIKIKKTNFDINNLRLEESMPNQHKSGFLHLFYSIAAYVAYRHDIVIDLTHNTETDDNSIQKQYDAITQSRSTRCDYHQDDYIKQYTMDKHDVYEHMYGFLRDVFRMILVIRAYLCGSAISHRPDIEAYYKNQIYYCHNTIAKLKQGLIIPKLECSLMSMCRNKKSKQVR